MPKSRKKPHPIEQKIAAAQSYNFFVEQLKLFLRKAVGPSVFHLLPPAEVARLYSIRNHAVRVQAAAGHTIPSRVLKSIKQLATFFFTNTMVKVGIGELEEVSFRDYFSMLFTLINYATMLKEDAYKSAPQVKQALSPFASLADNPDQAEAWHDYETIKNLLACLHSATDDCFYAARSDVKTYKTGNTGIGFCMELYSLPAIKINISLEGKSRPAYRIAWAKPEPSPHLAPVSITADKLHLRGKRSFGIYIQTHALQRLTERMDGIDTGILHFCLYLSCVKPVFCKNRQGEWLLSYQLMDIKTGYFVVDVVHDKMVLRTFLFLTYNGTPEGEKLNEQLGLRKEDKAWLAIDKLSTFLNSDISSDPRLRQLFIHAGCEGLLSLERGVSFLSPLQPEKQVADFITRYLQLGNDKGIA